MKQITPAATIGVIGAGTMGQGIAQVCAMKGFKVILFDISDGLVQGGRGLIYAMLDRLAEKGKILSRESERAKSLITTTITLADVKADLIIEAVVENPAVKQKLFADLEKVNGPDTLLTTNTSSLSVSQIGRDLAHPHRFAGLHFFNPAPVMKLVEVVKGRATSSETITVLQEFCRSLDKQGVLVQDSPGFIVNRVARPYYTESLRVLEEKVCDEAGIDKLLRAVGFKMGPFELMDLIGVDTNLSVTKSVYEAFGKASRFEPSPIQQRKVDEGFLGRKTGKGFYEYS